MTATLVDAPATPVSDRPIKPTDGRHPVRRPRRAPLPVHLLLLGVVLLCLIPATRWSSAVTTDEGSYRLQVAQILHGHWSLPYQAATIDQAGRWEPMVNGTWAGPRWFPYVVHPAYPLVLAGAVRVLGNEAGTHALGLLGVLGVAAAAYLLAAELGLRRRALAFWLAALGPALFNGYVVWAHAPSAAVAGLAVVCVARARRSRRPLRMLAAGLTLLAVAQLLRPELALFTIAVGVVTGVIVAGRRRASGGPAAGGVRGGVLVAGVFTACAVGVRVIESAWVGAIVGAPFRPPGVRQTGAPFVRGRIDGALHTLLTPSSNNGRLDFLLILALALLLGGAVLVRVTPAIPGRRLVPLVAGAALLVVVVVARIGAAPTAPIFGIVPAWPVLLVTLPFVCWRAGSTVERGLVAVVVVFTAAVLGTQYSVGGGLEWGGRYLSPALPLLAALAAAGAERMLRRLPGTSRRIVAAVMVAVVVAPAVLAVTVLGERRRAVAGAVAEITALHPAVVVTSSEALPRNAWMAQRDVEWLLVPPAELGDALGRLRAAGVSDVVVVEPPGVVDAAVGEWRGVHPVPAPWLEASGYRVVRLQGTG